MSTNYLALRSSAIPALNAVSVNYSTLTGSTLITSTIRFGSTLVSLGQSTNQTVSNFSNGSYATGWVSTLTGLSAIKKITMSQSGQSQYVVQNGNSTINATVNSGVSWTSLTGSTGLPAGATAYPQATASGTPAYTSISESATGQYVLAAVSGGLLYTSANYGSTFSALGMGTPTVYLPFENSVTDVMGGTPTATGSPGFVTGVVGSYALNLNNSTPGSSGATKYITEPFSVSATSNFSFSGWFNVQVASLGQSCIIGFGQNNNSNGNSGEGVHLIVRSNNTVYLEWYNSSNVWTTLTGPTISTNTWYSFTVIIQPSGTNYLYINNVPYSAPGSTINLAITSFTIGMYAYTGNAGSGSFNGYVDDVRIYNSAVTFSPVVPMNWLQTAVSGTGQYQLATSTTGLFLSTNYGATWTMVVNVGGWTGLSVSASGQYMAALSTTGTYAPYYSTNYGTSWTNSTFNGVAGSFLAISGNGQYSLSGYGTTALLVSNYLVGYTTAVYSTPTFSPSIGATINCASISATGQYMTVLTQGTTNNVYYSTNYGASFTALTIGSSAMTSCAISYDGSYITVSNATTVYTLNLNSQGYTVSVGNQAGSVNQASNAIAIGNQAGQTNQSANSIVLNGSGSALNAYLPGLFVNPIAGYGTSYSSSFSLLGYGSDSQVVQSNLSVWANGTIAMNSSNILNSISNSYDILQQWYESTNNASYVQLMWLRESTGSTWQTASQRFQVKTDATWQGFIEFNGTNNNYGVTIGAGGSTTNPNNVPGILYVATGGYVGIGTTSPYATLHVKLGTNIDSTNQPSGTWASIVYNATNGSQNHGLLVKNNWRNNGDNTYIFQCGNDLVNGAYAPYFSVMGGGYVGIGTASPSSNLHVYGNSSSYTTGLLTLINTNTTSAAGTLYLLAPNMTASGSAQIDIVQGHDATNYNAMTLGFYYVGIGSTTNYYQINTYGNLNAGLVVTTGGNVGIGTTNPSYPLHVIGSTSISTPAYFALTNTGGGATGSSDTTFAQLTLGANYGPWIVATQAANHYTDAIRLDLCTNLGGNNQTIVPRISIPGGAGPGAGNVGIGTTNPSAPLHIVGSGPGGSPLRLVSNTSGNEVGIGIFRNPDQSTPSTGDQWVIGMNSWGAGDRNIGFGCNNTNSVLTLNSNGTVNIRAYTTNGTVTTINSIGLLSVSSDRRIKENITYVSDTSSALTHVLNLKPATYNMIGASETYLGFIAQDVEQEIPLAVDGKKYEWQWELTEDGTPKFDDAGNIIYKVDENGQKIIRPRGVHDRALIATQTLAIQELSNLITSQATQINQLQTANAALESQLTTILARLTAANL